jgi:hypothetical protein
VVTSGRRQGKRLSDMVLSEVVRRTNEEGEEDALPRWRDAEGRAAVPHGFRFRSAIGLARRDRKAGGWWRRRWRTPSRTRPRAYARSDLLEKRRPLMVAWAELAPVLRRMWQVSRGPGAICRG